MTDTNNDSQSTGGEKADKKAQAVGSVVSATPESKQGKINPSAPGETGTTPGSNAK